MSNAMWPGGMGRSAELVLLRLKIGRTGRIPGFGAVISDSVMGGKLLIITLGRDLIGSRSSVGIHASPLGQLGVGTNGGISVQRSTALTVPFVLPGFLSSRPIPGISIQISPSEKRRACFRGSINKF